MISYFWSGRSVWELWVMIKKCKDSKGEKKWCIYNRITTSGSGLDKIPVLLDRKKASQINKLKIVVTQESKYFLFALKSDKRFQNLYRKKGPLS